MRHRIITGGLLASSLIMVATAYYVYHNPEAISWCPENVKVLRGADIHTYSCPQFYWHYISLAVLRAWPVLLSFSAVLFVKEEVFRLWWKIALLYAVPAMLLIRVLDVNGDLVTPPRDKIVQFLSYIFVGLSVAAIIYKYWLLKKRRI